MKPVVIIPGFGGSTIRIKFNRLSVKHFYCFKKCGWHDLWPTLSSLTWPAINCWVDNFKLLWNAASKKYSNLVGVSTRIPHFSGSTLNFENIDRFFNVGRPKIYQTMIKAMIRAGGIRNVSIRGVPYDFRRSPSSAYNGNWISRMTSVVEDTYNINNRTRVTLLSHSLGCMFTLYFLNHKNSTWKEKYILRWISTQGPFGGAMTALKALLSGENWGIPSISALNLRELQRSWESSLMLAPTPQVWGTITIVQTPIRNYSAKDYQVLFKKAKFAHGYKRYQLVSNVAGNLIPPGVETLLIYSYGIQTLESFSYFQDDNFDNIPKMTYEDGDGTVHIRSPQNVIERWRGNNNGYQLDEKAFASFNHMNLVTSSEYIREIIQLLQYNTTNAEDYN